MKQQNQEPEFRPDDWGNWDELVRSTAEEWDEDSEYTATFDSVERRKSDYLRVRLIVQGRNRHKQEFFSYITSLRYESKVMKLRAHFNSDKNCTVKLRDVGKWVIAQIKFPDGEVIL